MGYFLRSAMRFISTGKSDGFFCNTAYCSGYVFAITFYLYKAGKITFSASLLGTTLYKGETASLKITAENASILPAPFIAVSLFSADSFERSDDSKTSVGFTFSQRGFCL